MTSSGGTGRPATGQGTRENAARPDPEDKGTSPQTGGNGTGPIAEEVAAALRAQDSRGQNQNHGRSGRNRGAKGGSGSGRGKDGQRKAPDPAVNTRRDATEDDGSTPRGAAAARVATTTSQRTRQDTTPREQNTTPNPWARPAGQPEAPTGEQKTEPEKNPRQGPVPPPSLVAQQRQESPVPTVMNNQPTKPGGQAPPVSPATPPPAPSRTPAAPAPQSGVEPIVPSAVPSVAPVAANAVAAPPGAPTPPPKPIADDTEVSIEAVPVSGRSQTGQTRRSAAAPRRVSTVRTGRFRLLRVEPWSVMKTAFLLSVALGITLFVTVAVLWSVLDAAGVFDSLDDIVTDMTASDTNSGVDINDYIELSRVLGFATLIAVVDVVLLTALATLGAFLYNLSASLLGGLELTIGEDD